VNFIDSFLNSITMYRLLLYYLILLLVAALVLSLFGIIHYSPLAIIFSISFLLLVCWVTNKVFSIVFEAPTNFESVYITALILALIVAPAKDLNSTIFLFWIGVLAMSSKYILALNKKHIFNPAALAVFITAYTIGKSANWWVGTSSMVPFVLLGIFIVRKIRRFDLFFYFSIASLFTILGLSFLKGSSPIITLQKTFLDSPFLFFSFVMLTEPLTTPPTKMLQSIYGVIVGVLFSPQINIYGFVTTPEMALIVGNIYSYFVSPKLKDVLSLKEKIQVAPDIFDFVFSGNSKFNFIPGQYLEWTLSHKSPDSRGNRRYFTIASSPTEDNLRIGVKFYPKPSSFKRSLQAMDLNGKIVGGSLAGDFTLPKDPNKKLVFIAGGIGVTPFRSMIKYLIDTGQKRDIVLFYSNKFFSDIVYQQIFSLAEVLGIRTIYTLSELDKIPVNWSGGKGPVSEEMIKKEVPDFKERTFYLSGPHGMVAAFEKTLKGMGLSKSQIKIDYFPGFA
jgi:ferredoxin-NADP reductase